MSMKFSPIDFNSKCGYLDADLGRHQHATQYLPNIRNFCTKIVLLLIFIRNKLIIITKQFMIF